MKRPIEQGRIIGEAQNFTRDLVNEPGNRMTPTILADRAKEMCDEVGTGSARSTVRTKSRK